jgi:hypothetical protein
MIMLWRDEGLVINTVTFGFMSAKYIAFMAIVVVLPLYVSPEAFSRFSCANQPSKQRIR